MKTVYYITRTLLEDKSGGSIVRRGSVHFLKREGYRVVVVALSHKNVIEDDTILIKGPKSKIAVRFYMLLFAMGFISDYLEPWSKRAFKVLKRIVKKDDVVLATSGGELATLLLASRLKQEVGCKVVLNLHDPTLFTLIEGEFLYKSRMTVRPRDEKQEKIFKSVDRIVTSSMYYCNTLKKKYPYMDFKFSCHHFGYINEQMLQFSIVSKRNINVVYGGNMGKKQSPEILLKVAKSFPNIQFTFIGNIKKKDVDTYSNVVVIPLMSHEEYVKYIMSNADIGFLSLVGNVSRYCVPSKLYEYINVGLPVLAAIEGDARDIINENGYGIATDYNVGKLISALQYLLTGDNLTNSRNNLLREKKKWFMGSTIKELIEAIES